MKRTAAIAMLLCLSADAAEAQPKWAPIFVLEGKEHDAKEAVRIVRRLANVLREDHAIALEAPTATAQRFEKRHSLSPVSPEAFPEDRLDQYADSMNQALQKGYDAKTPEAWQDAQAYAADFSKLSRQEQDHVRMRRSKVASQQFEFCTMQAESYLVEGQSAAARTKMRECIFSTPGQQPSNRSLDAAIAKLYEEVLQDLVKGKRASLEVDAIGGGNGMECFVTVNGRTQSNLPFRGTDLLPLTVRVQVHCDTPRRIHVVRLSPNEPNTLTVDLRFEQVVRTSTEDSGRLVLLYGSAQEREQHMMLDTVSVAKVLEADTVVLVQRSSDPDKYVLSRFNTELQREEGQVIIRRRPSDEEVFEAARAVAEGRRTEIVPPERPRYDATAGADGGVPWAETALLLGGAAGLTIGWVSLIERDDARQVLTDPGSSNVVRAGAWVRFEDHGTRSTIVGSLGAGLATAGVATILPHDDGIPVWSWIVGAAGAGTVATGAVLLAGADDCSLSACEADGADPQVREMLLWTGVPLLAVPATHGLRLLFSSDSVSASAGPNGVRFSGRF